MDNHSPFYTLRKYFSYWKESKTKFKIHSPNVFEFIHEVLEAPKNIGSRTKELKKIIKKNKAKIKASSFGAKGNTENLAFKPSSLSKRISVRPKYGRLMFHLVSYLKSSKVLELGSGLGVSASYLSSNAQVEKLVSVEADINFVELNRANFSSIGADNVSFEHGLIEDKIPELMQEQKFDLVFVDGNHTKAATLQYFQLLKQYGHQNLVVVFDDIYWSEGMTEAWEEIKADADIPLTLDLFQFGIIFFNSNRKEKEHFVLWY